MVAPSVITAFGRQDYGEFEGLHSKFKVSLNYIVKLSQKTRQTNKITTTAIFLVFTMFQVLEH